MAGVSGCAIDCFAVAGTALDRAVRVGCIAIWMVIGKTIDIDQDAGDGHANGAERTGP